MFEGLNSIRQSICLPFPATTLRARHTVSGQLNDLRQGLRTGKSVAAVAARRDYVLRGCGFIGLVFCVRRMMPSHLIDEIKSHLHLPHLIFSHLVI